MLTMWEDAILAALIFAAALLYSSVGHGGASGYLAAMALMGVAPAVMRPTALTLNALVSLIALVKFVRAGAFSWRLFWPLAAASAPCAYIGGTVSLPGSVYKSLVGVVLLCAAWRIFRAADQSPYAGKVNPRVGWLLGAGAALGLLAGLTGVGGGIFLSPLLLFLRWADIRAIAGVSAAFILVNSVSGIIGMALTANIEWSGMLLGWTVAAALGGFIGAECGSRRLGRPALRRALAAVLIVAGIKMIAAP